MKDFEHITDLIGIQYDIDGNRTIATASWRSEPDVGIFAFSHDWEQVIGTDCYQFKHERTRMIFNFSSDQYTKYLVALGPSKTEIDQALDRAFKLTNINY